MKDDLIKRSDAIGAITNYCENECYYRVDNWCPQCQREEFQEAIKAVPSVDRPQEWISCSERLPSEDEQDSELGVIVTLGNGYSGIQYDWYHDGYWYDWNGFVVAWMPLPEPWEGADDE